MDFSRPPRLHTQFSSSPTEPTMLTDAHFAQRNGVKAPHTHSSTTHAVHRSRPQSPKDPIVANGDHGGRRSIAHGVSSAPSASVISAKKELSTSPIEISAFSDDEHDDFYDYHDSDRKKSGVRNLLSKISHWRGTEKAVCGKLLHYDSLLKAKSISDGLIISWFMDPSPNDASKSVSLKLLRAIEQEAVEGFQTWLLLGSKRRKLFDESCKAMTLYSEETRISFVLVIYKFIWANIKKALEYAKVNKHQLSQKDLAVVLYLLSRMDAGEDLSPHTQRRVGEQKSAFSPAILLGILQETGEFLVSNTFKSCIASCLPESDQTALIYYLSSTARISSPAYCPSDADVRVLSCESCSISKFWTTSFTSGAGKFRLVDVGSPDCHSFQLLGKIRKAAKIMLFYVDLMEFVFDCEKKKKKLNHPCFWVVNDLYYFFPIFLCSSPLQNRCSVTFLIYLCNTCKIKAIRGLRTGRIIWKLFSKLSTIFVGM
eukprot:TRINITY_DN745_c0_g1_i2.p1 TRINITY_DN745_c0_g1~~TRINITY_DN745_c0_g1_i2.p1  ORF type:complete len:484 (+),score=66.76 TRINITY_DN745_c0_g1_i2:58-1509(+)